MNRIALVTEYLRRPLQPHQVILSTTPLFSSFSAFKMPTYTGSCYCRAIEYELELSSPDEARTSLCHCRNCKVEISLFLHFLLYPRLTSSLIGTDRVLIYLESLWYQLRFDGQSVQRCPSIHKGKDEGACGGQRKWHAVASRVL
jgi:Uncharacterized conserved protein